MSYILLTIDVEDWFQVENFKQCIPFSSWPSRELRVEKNTHRLLDLLDSIELAHSSKLTASFFILGWIAKRLPHLVREIHARGHEVASHGYNHNLCNQQSPDALKKDLTDSKKLLEDIIGVPIYGYRAPSFAINEDILKVIQDCGYLYDSSYNSFSMHGRYGQLSLSQNGRKGIVLQIPDPRPPTPSTHYQQPATRNEQPATSILYELPISNLKFSPHGAEIRNLIFPWGGGAYFRLIPFPLFKIGVQSIIKRQGVYLFYLHPWEIDPQQPKVKDAPAFFKFRHYINLSKTHSKLFRLIQSFQHCHFATCSQYLSTMSLEL